MRLNGSHRPAVGSATTRPADAANRSRANQSRGEAATHLHSRSSGSAAAAAPPTRISLAAVLATPLNSADRPKVESRPAGSSASTTSERNPVMGSMQRRYAPAVFAAARDRAVNGLLDLKSLPLFLPTRSR